ncbi:MAG: (d)CMP kinase [Pirellulaceae bacterium]|jgi:cytidylate kinase|nr:(d)CMP kinase [Pirellulaceae bacterium]MDP7018929.1 (d)CMP kinase [Pirellulaceae bacterium]
MSDTQTVVTIDGPAGAGKSSVARQLAARLGYEFLDTGAMYRCVALAGLRGEVDWSDERDVAELATAHRIQLDGERVWLDDNDVTHEIRATRVTRVVHLAADQPAVRAHLVQLQREAAAGRAIVTEGRDQGTVVFPDADCKIFLTATAEERARRRVEDLKRRGETPTYQDVFNEQNERDRRDETREVGRLVKADDAIQVLTDGMPRTDVVDALERIVLRRLSQE